LTAYLCESGKRPVQRKKKLKEKNPEEKETGRKRDRKKKRPERKESGRRETGRKDSGKKMGSKEERLVCNNQSVKEKNLRRASVSVCRIS
jgi:hypothetical protein